MTKKILCCGLWLAALLLCGFQAQNFPGVGLATSSGGTTNTIPKFTASSIIGNSSVTDNATTLSTTDTVFNVPASGVHQFSSDTGISRDAAGVIDVGTGAQGSFAGSTKVTSDIVAGANGETWTQGSSSELLTIAAAATTDTTGNLLPANSIIEAVVVRVTTVIPTAATFTVGDATIAGRFATGVTVAANSTAVGTIQADQTGTSGPRQTSAAKIRITPNLTPGTATGVVRITVFWRQYVPPTS